MRTPPQKQDAELIDLVSRITVDRQARRLDSVRHRDGVVGTDAEAVNPKTIVVVQWHGNCPQTCTF